MRLLRLFFLSVVILFAIIFAVSLMIPSRVRISRAINLSVQPQLVAATIADMRDWKQWNPFFANVQPGSISAADSSNGQLVSMTVNGTTIRWKSKTPGELIASMDRPGKNSVLNGWNIMQVRGKDYTTVKWYMDFQLHWYPWEKLGSLMFERSYGPKMEQGLINLKKFIHDDRISH